MKVMFIILRSVFVKIGKLSQNYIEGKVVLPLIITILLLNQSSIYYNNICYTT